MVTKEDILEALGIEARQDRFLAGILVGAGVGAVVGSAVTLLLAPRSGRELREKIGERRREMSERVRARMPWGEKQAESPPPGADKRP
ncbi:MAG: YtxH domain-containing protein [Deltaproteobacteria bacterium]|nr:YtxH domain-containing protein [Deltaproteobacteria bacterium]